MDCEIRNLKNGRIYKITDTSVPYKEGEYPLGGFTIHRYNKEKARWDFIDDSPNKRCVESFLKAVERV